jgi:NADPH:quinone reductase-like Zn-dependent oxidoreductase
MKPDAGLLASVARELAAGTLQSKVAETVDFQSLSAAIERNRTQPRSGKVVLDLSL